MRSTDQNMKDSPNFRGHLSQSCLNTRRKQLHRGPHSECPKPCGFREAGKPGESTLGPIFTPGRRDQTGRNSGVRGTRNPLLERPFTLTHIHEICTKFNEGLHLSQNGQLCVCIRESIGSVYTSAFIRTYQRALGPAISSS